MNCGEGPDVVPARRMRRKEEEAQKTKEVKVRMPLTPEELQAEMEKLREENHKLRVVSGERTITFKISPRYALSVYGLGRFPVTLYKDQWTRLLGQKEAMLKFIERNDHGLASKDNPDVQYVARIKRLQR